MSLSIALFAAAASAQTADDAASNEEEFAIEAPQSTADVVDSLHKTLLGIWDSFVDHTPYLLAGLLVLVLTWLVAAVLRRTARKALHRSHMRSSLQELVERLVTIVVWCAGLLLAALFWFPGLTPTTALGGLGLLSVAVGFAFQDIFENFFAGVLLLWRFPFESGDFIECEGILGKVEEVTIRMTKLRLTSGELMLVPNSVLFKNPVNVLTGQGKRRVEIMTGVAYGEDLAQAVRVIEDAVKNCSSVAPQQPVQVFPQAFGSSSMDIEVAWWTDPTPLDIRSSRAEVVIAIKEALDNAGIEIPFPYRTLTFSEPLRTRMEDVSADDS